MQTTWIVVADAGRARVLSQFEESTAMPVVHDFDNPSGRAHTIDMVTDAPGRLRKGRGGARSVMDPRTDRHEQRAKEFAHKLCRLCDQAPTHAAFDRLVIVAPPHFLGLLRSGIRPAAKKRLVLCSGNDLTRLSLRELRRHLGALLIPRPAAFVPSARRVLPPVRRATTAKSK